MSDEKLVVMVTGGMGFIGSQLIKCLLNDLSVQTVLNVDSLTYAAAAGSRFGVPSAKANEFQPGAFSPTNYAPNYFMPKPGKVLLGDYRKHVFVWGGVQTSHESLSNVMLAIEDHQPHYILHLAAESHVDRAIEGDTAFCDTNVRGTASLLQAARRCQRLRKFVYVSTDEVYGSALSDAPHWHGFRESDRVACGNPYSATKLGGEQLALAYHNTYGLPVVVTRGSNTFGPWQHPEKFIPVVCDNAINNRSIPLYGDGQQQRQWLSLNDHAYGLWRAATHGERGEIYNLGGSLLLSNKGLASLALQTLDRPAELLTFVTDRPGHDRHYQICRKKTQEQLGWSPRSQTDTLELLRQTFLWYQGAEGQAWLRYVNHNTQGRLGLCQRASS